MSHLAAPSRPAPEPESPRVALLVTVCYAVVVGAVLWRHEMWRDELQAWMLARDSATFGELLGRLRFEGHPPLWYALLFGLSRVTRAPEAMQVLHWVIACATAWVVVRWMPGTRLQRVLAVCGFFLAYEYAVISRSYALGALLLFTACTLQARRAHPALTCAVLALLAQTSAFGWLIAGAFATALLVDLAWTRRYDAIRSAVPGALFLLASAALALGQMLPPANAVFRGAPASVAQGSALRAAAITIVGLWESYAPVLRLTHLPLRWQELALLGEPGRPVLAVFSVLSVLAFAGAAWALRRHRLALCFFLLATLALQWMFFARFSGSLFHHGHLFLVLLAATWLAAAAGAPAAGGTLAPRLFTLLLAVQAAAGLTELGIDAVLPFSGARAAAHEIAVRSAPGTPIVATPAFAAAPVSGFLDRPLFYVEFDTTGTYMDWSRRYGPTDAAAIRRAAEAHRGPQGDVLLLLRDSLPAVPGAREQLLARVPPGLEPSEAYYLYRLPPP